MNTPRSPSGFTARPVGADAWVGASETPPAAKPALVYTARLTIDVTPAMRGRIKVAAFHRGQTVADMLRALFDETFPDTPGGAP